MIENLEVASYKYKIYIVSKKLNLKNEMRFIYNTVFTLGQNADVISNHISLESYGVSEIEVRQLTMEEIYCYCRGDFNKKEQSVKLVVKRIA